MKKLSIADAAKILGITKEAVYNRIRRNSLKSVVENGTKFVIIEDEKPKKEGKKDGNFVGHLLNQIDILKQENNKLLEQKDEFFKEKERILIAQKDEIKEIYAKADEKFRQFFLAIQRPLIARKNGEYIQAVDVEFEELESQWIDLDIFLSNLNLKNKKQKKLKNYLLGCFGKKKFIKFEDGSFKVKSNLEYKKLKEKM